MSDRATALEAANALPVGQRLHEFELRGVIGVGGFGIVYRAFDQSLQREVAIKEYMPAALAGRSGKFQVSLLSQAHADTFALGLGSFVNEARLLARFDHPSLVKVHRFWEEHGTAYMVMPLYRGRTLRELRQAMPQAPTDGWIRQLLEQLLGALEVMHREAVYHRDIAPDNILVSDDAPAVLLDFGAARRVISDRSQMLTAILKPSYAPIEQYAESTGARQGPWTDFYALGATLHFIITGKPPLPATARAISDDQPRLGGSGQGGLSDSLLQVCDWMIAPRPSDRPQNVSEIRAALAGRMPIPTRQPAASATSWQATVVQPAPVEPLLEPAPPVPTTRPPRRIAGTLAWSVVAASVAAVGLAVDWGSQARTARADNVAAVAPANVVRDAMASTATAAPNPVPTDQAGSSPPAAETVPAPTTLARPNTSGAEVEPPARPTGAAAAVVQAHADAPADAPAVARKAPHRPPRAAAAAESESALPTPVAPPRVALAASVARAEPGNPRDQCSGRHLIALHRCLVRECEKAVFQDHPQCQRVRAIEERTRRTVNAS